MSLRKPVYAAVALALTASLAATGIAQASELEDRVARIETLMQSQGLIDMLTQLQQLQREVQELRGEVEVQGNQLRQMQEQQRSLYLDIDRRLQQAGGTAPGAAVPIAPAPGAVPATPPEANAMPGAAAGMGSMAGGSAITPSAPAAASPGAAATPPGLPATTPAMPVGPGSAAGSSPIPQAATASPDEQAAYEQALNILREGRYADAAAAYRKFLDTYPNGRYADNAQYWLAETQYVTRQFPQALEEFGKVVNSYTNSVKAPDALLKTGYIHYELGDWKSARENLQAVKQRFPDSTAARLAGERLQRMDREGR